MVFETPESEKRPRRLKVGYLDLITEKLLGISSNISGSKSPILGPRKPYSPFSSPASSVSSSSSFWMPRRSSASRTLSRLLPYVTKRQFAVLTCVFLTVFVWFVPPPSTWHRATVASVDQLQLYPYIFSEKNKKAYEKNPALWLEKNSNNKHSI